jgi:hypothetical protein
MGNHLYKSLFEATQRINENAFAYCKKQNVSQNEALFEIETDDFTNVADIRQKLQSLPETSIITKRIDTDILPALQYYLNQQDSNKAILSQTDYFIFQQRIPLLSIKNTKAAANRITLAATTTNATALQAGNYVASCDLNALWTGPKFL